MPKCIIIAAQSLDGFITRGSTPGTAFTSNEDKIWFQDTLAQSDWVVMGSRTYEIAKPAIKAKNTNNIRWILTRHPEKYLSEDTSDTLKFVDFETFHQHFKKSAPPKIAIVGGAQINRLFLENEIATDVWITLEPYLFGSGVPLSPVTSPCKLELNSVENLSKNTLLLKYTVSPKTL